MNDNERLQFAANLLMQRLVAAQGDAVNGWTEAEAQKQRADALQKEIDELKKAND